MLHRANSETLTWSFCLRRLQKVGWIFTQSSKERDYILSSEEVGQIAAIQDEIGETAVTAVVSVEEDEDGSPDVHFEAFQVIHCYFKHCHQLHFDYCIYRCL